jgi:PAS domain S-box-containing protein
MKPARILIVDDNPTNLALLSNILDFEGYHIVEAPDAETAQQLIAEDPPDLILMDVGLPGMDGLTLTRALKGNPATRHILIAVVTAGAMKGDDDKAREAGCDAYITKPIDTRALPGQVAALLGRVPLASSAQSIATQTGTPLVASAVGDASGSRRMLVVDDVAANRFLLREILESSEYVVEEAADGVEALAVLDRLPVAVVISDALMPNMDGFRLCLELRKNPKFERLPVVIYTSTYNSAGDRALAEKVGANAYLVKPAPREAILATITEAVHAAETRPVGPAPVLSDEFNVIKRYNAALVSKLEERNDDLSRVVAELREAGEFSRQIISGAREGIAVFDRELRYLVFNPDMEEIMEAKAFDRLGQRIEDATASEQTLELIGRLRRALRGEVVHSGDRFLTRPSGTGVWIVSRSSPLRNTQGQITGVISLVTDITERKRTENALRESEAQFRQVVENINEVFLITDLKKNAMIYVSPAYEAIWGRTVESLYANPLQWVDAIHPADRKRVLAAAQVRQNGGDYDEVYRIHRPDESSRWIHERSFPVRDADGNIFRLVGTAEDITDRKRAEIRASVQHIVTGVLSEGAPLLSTAKRLLEVLCRDFDWVIGDFWAIDRSTRTLRCVEIWHPPEPEFLPFAETTRLTAFAAGVGLPGLVWKEKSPQWLGDLETNPTFLRRAAAAALGLRSALALPIKLREEVYGVVEFFSTRSRAPDEGLLDLLAGFGTQIGQFIERKQLEDQFRQAQKMEAIGTLAGGIAHDFNNVLAAITGYTELAKMQMAENTEAREYLQSVSVASGRAVDLVRQILAFSRVQEQQRKRMQLWPIVDEALKLLRATIPTTIEFDISLDRRAPAVLGDPTQIHQIMMNLATNAAHAMKDRPGRLGVLLEQVEVGIDLAALHPGLRPGPYMRLGVSDTGHGMDAVTAGRIFDPFFTTKAPGEGTGLGLAVVHGIVRNHDGVITVYSQPGKGTQFHLYFPVHLADMDPGVPEEPVETPRGNHERILLVDDEIPLALMGRKMLERLNYLVDSHTAPADALAAVLANPGDYDLVLSDLTMPGMTGVELARQISHLRPDLPIILITGYSATLTLEKVRALGVREILLKPLTLHALGEAIHRTLTPTAK